MKSPGILQEVLKHDCGKDYEKIFDVLESIEKPKEKGTINRGNLNYCQKCNVYSFEKIPYPEEWVNYNLPHHKTLKNLEEVNCFLKNNNLKSNLGYLAK